MVLFNDKGSLCNLRKKHVWDYKLNGNVVIAGLTTCKVCNTEAIFKQEEQFGIILRYHFPVMSKVTK